MTVGIDRSEISVVVDGKLVDYVERMGAYTREQELNLRLNTMQADRDSANRSLSTANGRLATVERVVARLLTEGLDPANDGWIVALSHDDLSDLKSAAGVV
jgi:hypothetical protein